MEQFGIPLCCFYNIIVKMTRTVYDLTKCMVKKCRFEAKLMHNFAIFAPGVGTVRLTLATPLEGGI